MLAQRTFLYGCCIVLVMLAERLILELTKSKAKKEKQMKLTEIGTDIERYCNSTYKVHALSKIQYLLECSVPFADVL